MTGALILFLGVTVISGLFLQIGFAGYLPHSPFMERFIQFVPVSVLTAFVASTLYRQPDHLTMKLITLFVALGVMRCTRHLGVTVITGLVILGILTWLLG
jgi:branched-subunit amino acid transport protein